MASAIIETEPRVPPVGLRVVVTPIRGHTPSTVMGTSDQLVFPAVLDSLEVQKTATFGDYDSVGAGSFSVRRGGDRSASELESLTLNVFASDAPFSFLQGDAPSSWAAMRSRLDQIFDARFPVHLKAVVVRGSVLSTLPVGFLRGGNSAAFGQPGGNIYIFNEDEADHADLDLAVTFRSLTRRLDPGQPDARYFSLGVKEWRNVHESTVGVKYASTNSGRARGVHLPATHIVKGNETLADVATHFYGRSTYWREIRRHNAVLRLKNVAPSRPLKEYGIASFVVPPIVLSPGA